MSLFSPFLPLIMGGKTKFQPVYVEDVCKGTNSSNGDSDITTAAAWVLTCLVKPSIDLEVFNNFW